MLLSAPTSVGESERWPVFQVRATRTARRPRSPAAAAIGAVFHSNASSDTPTNNPDAALAAGDWAATSNDSDARVINHDHLIPAPDRSNDPRTREARFR